MNLPETIRIVEVGPRDGLQNEKSIVATEVKIRLIEMLVDAGCGKLEVGSFVSPKWVPQMADTAAVLAGLPRGKADYAVLVPNRRGLDLALAARVEEISVFAAASETFSHKNTNCSIAESLQRLAEVASVARDHGVAVRGYVSCVLGCPYEGNVAPEQVAMVAAQLAAMGCYEISLGDTIGVGTPLQARRMIETVAAQVPIDRLALHFHDTWGQALANLLAGLELGVGVIDSAVAGLGGCPYAKGATGNVATEDVVYMLNGMGIGHGIDLDSVAAAGRFIMGALGRESPSKAAQALAKRAASRAGEI